MMEHQGTKRLETQRLILRPFAPQDGPAMYKNWCGDAEVTKFLTWPPHASAEVSSSLAAYWAEETKNPERYQWAIVPRALGEPIGSLAVVRQRDDIAQCELGYCIGKAWWGKGIMTEAVKEVVRYLFEEVGMNRIEAAHDVHNPASGRVMQKAGMVFEGVHRQASKNNTGICDVAIYAILANEYRK